MLSAGTLRHGDGIRVLVKSRVVDAVVWLQLRGCTSGRLWGWWGGAGWCTTMVWGDSEVRYETGSGCQVRLHLATSSEATVHFLSLPVIHHRAMTGKFI